MTRKCPRCGSSDVSEVIYGLPGHPVPAGKTIGGCLVGPDGADWICGACKHEWQTQDSFRARAWADESARHQPPG